MDLWADRGVDLTPQSRAIFEGVRASLAPDQDVPADRPPLRLAQAEIGTRTDVPVQDGAAAPTPRIEYDFEASAAEIARLGAAIEAQEQILNPPSRRRRRFERPDAEAEARKSAARAELARLQAERERLLAEDRAAKGRMVGQDEAGGWTIDVGSYASLPQSPLTVDRAAEVVAEAAQRRSEEHIDAVASAARNAGGDYLEAATGARAAVREAAGWVFGETEPPEWVREAKARGEAALRRRVENARTRIEEKAEQIEGVLREPEAAIAEIAKSAERLQKLGAAVQAWAENPDVDRSMIELMLRQLGGMGVDLAIETADNHPIFGLGSVVFGDGRRRQFSLRDFNTRLEELERVAKAMGDKAAARALKRRKRQKHRDTSGEFDETRRAEGREDIRESGQDADFWLWSGEEARRAGFPVPFPTVKIPPQGAVGKPKPVYGSLDRLGRATSASALIPKGGVAAGSTVSETEVVGFVRDPSIVRAHLLRRMFGGSGADVANLTPFSRFDNHPVMYMIETSLERAIRTQNVQIEVRPLYRRKVRRSDAPAARLRPVAIVISARGSDGYAIDYLVPNVEDDARARRGDPSARRRLGSSRRP